MAEEAGGIDGNEALVNGADTMPQIGLISQYVKDLSFENPNSPAVYQWQGQPQIDVQFNIGSNQFADAIFELCLKIDVTAQEADGVAFQARLAYHGFFGNENL